MGYQVQSDTVYIDVYKAICNYIRDDEHIKKLSRGIVFDFDLLDNPPPPSGHKNEPRIYVIPNSVNYPLESSCNGDLQLEYTIVLEGLHFRDVRMPMLSWRLMFLLRYIPFTSINIDGIDFPVICTPGNGSWEYDPESRVMKHNLNLSVAVKV